MLVRSTKIRQRKELGNLKLNYEQLQNRSARNVNYSDNKPLKYYYADEN